jgi:hypothetical protein
MSKIALLAEGIVQRMAAHVAQVSGALADRLSALETKLASIPAGEKGDPGPQGERGEDGASVDMAAVAQMVADAVAQAVAALPPAAKGEKGDPGLRGEPGAAGKDADIPALQSFLQAEIKAAVAQIPPAKDGKDGATVHPDTVALMVRDAADKVVETLPKPRDGRDGFSLEDFTATTSEDGRTLTLAFQRGDVRKEFNLKLRAVNYHAVWREGTYQQDDIVTLGGCAWIAMRETSERPGTPGADTGWRLMVKNGRDGKDGAAPVAVQQKPIKV